jgi:hypothetical protein
MPLCACIRRTQWISDSPILRFIFDHLDKVQINFTNWDQSWPNQMIALLLFLEQVFSAVQHFEFDGASLTIVYPGVHALITFLQKQGDKIRSRKLTKVYQDSAVTIRKRTLDTTNDIFQLAFVLSPAGRE